ncbi:hypothetical protein EV126DRAFT_240363 [Verticillium dahliae]|nr:hypothetical protein EV126DRAFT_240363 [Verticillium dahliae]
MPVAIFRLAVSTSAVPGILFLSCAPHRHAVPVVGCSGRPVFCFRCNRSTRLVCCGVPAPRPPFQSGQPSRFFFLHFFNLLHITTLIPGPLAQHVMERTLSPSVDVSLTTALDTWATPEPAWMTTVSSPPPWTSCQDKPHCDWSQRGLMCGGLHSRRPSPGPMAADPSAAAHSRHLARTDHLAGSPPSSRSGGFCRAMALPRVPEPCRSLPLLRPS